MKYFLIIGINLSCNLFLAAQDILAYYGGTTYHTVKISADFINFDDIFCNKTFVHGNLSYQENGLLYTTWTHVGLSGSGIITNLKRFDLLNCDTVQISKIQGKRNSSFYCLVVDFNGKLYFYTRLNGKNGIYRSNFDFTNIDTLLDLDNVSNYIIEDLVVLGDRLLALNQNLNEIYEIDTHFTIRRIINPEFKITGLTTQYNSCKDKRIIVSGYPYSHSVWDSIFQLPDDKLGDTLYLYEYDYINNSFKPLALHIYPHGQEAFLSSLTSFDDILSSDPECVFLLDLDRDNSSGAFPYGFFQNKALCGITGVRLTDQDLYIETDLKVDSMQIMISGYRDKGFEWIQSMDPAFQARLLQRNDSLYTFVFLANEQLTHIRDIITSLGYGHSGVLQRTIGHRELSITLFAENSIRRNAVCKVDVQEVEYLLRDTTLCEGQNVQLTSGVIGGPGDTLILNQAQNISGCDSIELLAIKSFPVSTFKIIGDTVLCPGRKAEICVDGGTFWKWSGGETSRCIKTDQNGLIKVSITDLYNCPYEIAYQFKTPEPLDYIVRTLDPLCYDGADGSIQIENAGNTLSYFLNNQSNSTGQFGALGSGNYRIKLVDTYGCEYFETVNLENPPEINISFLDTLIVKDRIAQMQQIADLQGSLKEIIIEPGQGILKIANGLYEVNPQTGGHYKILAIDTNDCVKEYQFTVLLDLNYKVYYPNIFSPNEDGINDLWNVFPGSGYKGESLEIYNRWGERVYVFQQSEIGQRDQGWNGQKFGVKMLPGVYVFKLIVSDEYNKLKTLSGNLTLVR
ncbi:MAG: gliding motility-associated C-terminal domain-containing protein [Saprospiraceae bacterium]|nr:gliding motility-associated C-terminal domain-containing protein [Saprospiraceae bacterium]